MSDGLASIHDDDVFDRRTTPWAEKIRENGWTCWDEGDDCTGRVEHAFAFRRPSRGGSLQAVHGFCTPCAESLAEQYEIEGWDSDA